MPAIIKKGTPAIQWGTSNQTNVGTATGCIVESFKVSDKNGSPIEIEDNDGYAAVLVMHADEFDVDLSVLYDSGKTWPVKGDIVLLQLPKVNGAGGLLNVNCYLTSIDPEGARKKEGMLSIKLARRVGVLA